MQGGTARIVDAGAYSRAVKIGAAMEAKRSVRGINDCVGACTSAKLNRACAGVVDLKVRCKSAGIAEGPAGEIDRRSSALSGDVEHHGASRADGKRRVSREGDAIDVVRSWSQGQGLVSSHADIAIVAGHQGGWTNVGSRRWRIGRRRGDDGLSCLRHDAVTRVHTGAADLG